MSVVSDEPRTTRGQGSNGSLRAEVVEAGARLSTEQRRLAHLIVALDVSHEWALDGAATCARWVADALGMEVCTAREWLRVGRALGALEMLDEAFAAGRLSYSKIRTLTRVATTENQAELCTLAERVQAGKLGCALAAWQQQRETPEETEARQHAARGLGWRVDVDGTVVGWFRLAPADAAVVTQAIDSVVRRHQPDAVRGRVRRQGRSLALDCATARRCARHCGARRRHRRRHRGDHARARRWLLPRRRDPDRRQRRGTHRAGVVPARVDPRC